MENIKFFIESYKVLYHFTKKRSPNSILIVDDIDDSWFKHIITYKSKSGKIIRTNTIIEKDLNNWIAYLKMDVKK